MSDTSAQSSPGESGAKSRTKRASTSRKVAANKKGLRAARVVNTAKLDQFGFRLGTLKAKAAAMYAGKKGATLGDVKQALKSTQFNVLTELENKGYKVERTPVGGFNDRKVTRYHVVVK